MCPLGRSLSAASQACIIISEVQFVSSMYPVFISHVQFSLLFSTLELFTLQSIVLYCPSQVCKQYSKPMMQYGFSPVYNQSLQSGMPE